MSNTTPLHMIDLIRKKRDQKTLNEAEIRDVIAFMKTLNDGYSATAGGPKVAAR